MKSTIIISSFIIFSALSWSFIVDPEYSTEHPSVSTDFDIKNLSWMVGSWEGDGFGGVSEEMWAPAADGTMMGMYRHLQEGKLVFYEFLLLDETGIRLKHFHPDLKGWETKDEMVTFDMISASKDMLTLKGLTFERKGNNQMIINLKMRRGDKVETEVFTMNRVK